MWICVKHLLRFIQEFIKGYMFSTHWQADLDIPIFTLQFAIKILTMEIYNVVVVNFISNSQYKDTKILNQSIHNIIYWIFGATRKAHGLIELVAWSSYTSIHEATQIRVGETWNNETRLTVKVQGEITNKIEKWENERQIWKEHLLNTYNMYNR